LTITAEQAKALVTIALDGGLTPAEAQDVLEQSVGVRSTQEIPTGLYALAIDAMHAATLLDVIDVEADEAS
jgi:hypothetical protein